MRKLLLSLLAVCALGCLSAVHGVDWGNIKVYAAWEVTTDFGTGDSGRSQSAYVAIGSEKYLGAPYPTPGAPGAINWLAVYVSSSKTNYPQVANRVSLDLSNPTNFSTEWLLWFSTESGKAANLTFRCLENQLPNPKQLALRFLASDGTETAITAVQADEEQVVAVASATTPHTLLATYEVPYVEGVEMIYSLAPGWNLVGIPFQSVSDAGTLFDYPVLAVGSVITQVASASELACGAAYWVYNTGSETVQVTLTGVAYTGRQEGTAFPELADGWNYVSPIGDCDKSTKTFKAATEMAGVQFEWGTVLQCFGVSQEVPSVGFGYMVKE